MSKYDRDGDRDGSDPLYFLGDGKIEKSWAKWDSDALKNYLLNHQGERKIFCRSPLHHIFQNGKCVFCGFAQPTDDTA